MIDPVWLLTSFLAGLSLGALLLLVEDYLRARRRRRARRLAAEGIRKWLA